MCADPGARPPSTPAKILILVLIYFCIIFILLGQLGLNGIKEEMCYILLKSGSLLALTFYKTVYIIKHKLILHNYYYNN